MSPSFYLVSQMIFFSAPDPRFIQRIYSESELEDLADFDEDTNDYSQHIFLSQFFCILFFVSQNDRQLSIVQICCPKHR